MFVVFCLLVCFFLIRQPLDHNTKAKVKVKVQTKIKTDTAKFSFSCKDNQTNKKKKKDVQTIKNVKYIHKQIKHQTKNRKP